MNDKPMLSVERELLEAMHSHPDCPVEFIDHLRRAISQPMGSAFKRCSILKEFSVRASATTEAAKNQGEPVAWVTQCLISGLIEQAEPNEKATNLQCWTDAFPVYAEKPGPVADHTQCEECKGWGYHENHHEGGGTECGECDGSGNATVAVAVVMPPEIDREYFNDESMAAGWNECLEEVARLNGVNK